MLDKDSLDKLEKLFLKIKHKTIIVEGKRDKQALCSLGFSNVMTLNHGGLYETAEEVAGKEVVVLTDFDHEGRLIAGKLNKFLQSTNCSIDREARRIAGLCFTHLKIKTVEELEGFEWENLRHHRQSM